MVLLGSPAFSQIWIAAGPGPKNWNDGANWSTGVPPGAGQTAFFTGASNIACQLTANVIISNIVLSGFVGNINLNTFNLTIQPGGNNSFLSGNIVGTGNIFINSTSNATFDGTTFGANVNISATLTTATGIFTGGPGTTFGGNVTVTAHSILLNGSTYNGTTTLTKSSVATPVSSLGNGGNTFNGATTIVNDMNETFRTGSINPDFFSAQVTLALTGTSSACRLQVAYASAGNTFRNIRVRSDNDISLQTAELSFGAGGGTSTMASGFTIDEVTPGYNLNTDNEFNYGDLILNNFTQTGNTAQSINLRLVNPSVNNARFYLNNCTFNGTVTFLASNPYVANSTFNGVTTLTKTTGTGTDGSFGPPPHPAFTWDGGNTFNNTTTIRNLGQCTLVLGGTAGDVFNADVTFHSNQATSKFMIATTGTTIFRGNVSLTQSLAGPTIAFGYSGGIVSFAGATPQTLSSQYSIPTFVNLVMQNASGLTLSTPTVVTTSLDMTTGVITSTTTNYLSLTAGAIVTNASDASFVDGPVRKTGKVPFVFPIGDAGAYHPIAISAPSDVAAEFSAQYFLADHGLGSTADGGMVKVSDCEYWTLTRLVGTDNVSATPYWNGPSSFCHVNYITVPAQLQVARWSGTLWNNLGQTNLQTGAQPDGTDGNLTTSSALTNAASHTITFGSLDELNVLPINLISLTVTAVADGAEIAWVTASERNNAYFSVEKLEGTEFVELAKVAGAGTTSVSQSYKWTDQHTMPGLSYYRLKQTDIDGLASYSEVVAFQLDIDEVPYPNPVKGTLHLDGLKFDEHSIVVVKDISGHIVFTSKATKTIDLGGLVPGLYQVGIKSNRNIKWYRVAKE